MRVSKHDLLSHIGLVAPTLAGKHYGARPIGSGQTFAGKRIPHRLILKPGGVLCPYGILAQMKMIAVGNRETMDRNFACFRSGRRGTRYLRKQLQYFQCSKLQSIKFQRIIPARHSNRSPGPIDIRKLQSEGRSPPRLVTICIKRHTISGPSSRRFGVLELRHFAVAQNLSAQT